MLEPRFRFPRAARRGRACAVACLEGGVVHCETVPRARTPDLHSRSLPVFFSDAQALFLAFAQGRAAVSR